mmetsp:Transcript_8378/g.12391  ORF Transcript_8378/g.12391 Transcript_8378/m.12391 type:complete len:182 (+) Transcript_8378:35-580(+)
MKQKTVRGSNKKKKASKEGFKLQKLTRSDLREKAKKKNLITRSQRRRLRKQGFSHAKMNKLQQGLPNDLIKSVRPEDVLDSDFRFHHVQNKFDVGHLRGALHNNKLTTDSTNNSSSTSHSSNSSNVSGSKRTQKNSKFERVQEDIAQVKAVVDTPSFTQNGFALLKTHLQNRVLHQQNMSS